MKRAASKFATEACRCIDLQVTFMFFIPLRSQSLHGRLPNLLALVVLLFGFLCLLLFRMGLLVCQVLLFCQQLISLRILLFRARPVNQCHRLERGHSSVM